MTTTIPVFAYGSNLDERQMRRRCPGSVPRLSATLPGHRLAFAGRSTLWGGGVATVLRDSGSTVFGRVYDVTPDDLRALDACEGHPHVYRRGCAQVVLSTGRVQLAQVYRRNGTAFSPPSDDYFETIACAYSRLGFDEGDLEDAARGRRAGSSALHRVFIYGSLMRGFGNHRTLATNGEARFLGTARSSAEYTMIDLGSFPAVLEGGNTVIHGEVWEVDDACLAALDRLEGHPDFYCRGPITLQPQRNEATASDVVAYFLPSRRVRLRETVPSGNWRSHQMIG